MPVTEEFITQALSPDQTTTSSQLLALSSLTDAEASQFRTSWEQADGPARAHLLERLVSVAEDNAEANFDAVFRIALDDDASEIRQKTIDALWENQERWLLNKLASMAEEDSAQDVRAAASGALGKFVLLGALDELRPSLVDQVESALHRIIANSEEPVAVRRRAIEALAPSVDPSVNDVIRDAYYSDDEDLKISAVFSMGQHCDDGWLPVLLSELKNTDPAMRFEAARACGELEDERAVRSLIQLTGEDDAEVQEAAIEALGRIGGDEAKDALRRFVEKADVRLREAAQAALEEIAANENPLGFK